MKKEGRRKRKRLSTAQRRARIAATISLAQLRYSMQQLQVVAKVGNTQAWKDVRYGKLSVYRDGRETFVTREEAERYVRAKEQAARQAQHPLRAVPGRRGLQPPVLQRCIGRPSLANRRQRTRELLGEAKSTSDVPA